VRIEAIKSLPDLKGEISQALVGDLLADSDPKVAEAAAGVCGTARIASAVDPIVEMLRRPDPFGRQRQVRLRALRALGEIGDPAALPRISQFFRSVFALVNAEERHAAFESLRLYPEEARQHWVSKGLWSTDKKVREICRQLRTGGDDNGVEG
jgi:HEAT repeat protein